MPRDPLREGSSAASTEPLADSAERLLRLAEGGLSIIVHHRDGAEVALLEPDHPLVVGRSAPADMCVPDRSLSREHARFSLQGDRVVVEDLGSTNGTWLAGERVDRAVLGPGEEVMLGGTLARVHALGRRIAPEDAVAPAPAAWSESDAARDQALVSDAAMRELLETVARVATSRIPVILHGETGTGKEVLARLVHDGGPRRDRRMVRVNCGAIPAPLVESTFFGHEKGSFTGATQQQRGVFEEADTGTVFLDEIGELSPAAQSALLRVLSTGSFCRVGSSREIEVDVRVIAATHRDLEAMVEQGSFREDLYYRLSTMVLEVPPLRERVEAIGPLAARFLREASEASGRPMRGIAPDALEVLEAYRWPGNVRELRNAIERAVVVARGDVIRGEDLPARVRGLQPGAPHPTPASAPPTGEVRTRVQQYEARILAEALQAAGWNRSEAAERLGIPLRTLAHRMKLLGIKKPASAR
jgi:two-component system, NtrC family, response regulator AtoC